MAAACVYENHIGRGPLSGDLHPVPLRDTYKIQPSEDKDLTPIARHQTKQFTSTDTIKIVQLSLINRAELLAHATAANQPPIEDEDACCFFFRYYHKTLMKCMSVD